MILNNLTAIKGWNKPFYQQTSNSKQTALNNTKTATKTEVKA